jgi:ABC-type sugar transport system substrate-binding protein
MSAGRSVKALTLTAAALLAGVLAVAASGSSRAGIEAELAKLTKTNAVVMPKPTTPVAVGKHEVAVIAVGLAVPGANYTARYVQSAIKLAGWTAKPTYDGQFQPAVASGQIQDAINSGVDGIILISFDPATISAALAQANEKNVPVICILCGPPSVIAKFPGVTGIEPSPTLTGRAQALYALHAGGPKADIWVYEDKEFPFTVVQTAVAIKELRNRCKACKVHVVQMTAAQSAEPGLPILAGVLARYRQKGSIDVIIAPWDGPAAGFATLLQQRGRTEVSVVGYAGLAEFVSQIKAGFPKPAKATVAIPLPYAGYSAVDQLARRFANQPVWNGQSLGVSLITTENYKRLYSKSVWTSPGFDPAAFFAKLWKK